jgi:hypothetical protein
MYKFSWFLTLLLFISGMSSGQDFTNLTLSDFYREFKTSRFRPNDNQNSQLLGSPYEKEDFTPGEIVTVSRLRYTGIPLQMNLHTNNLEFKNEDGQVMYIGMPEIIDYAIIDGEKYIYAPYAAGSRIFKSYFTVLSEGRVILLQKKRIILKSAEPAQAYKVAVPAHYERSQDEFYLRILPGEAKKIANKKDLAEILGNYPTELDNFIRKNKIRFYRAEDVRSMMEYYNKLVSGS